MDDADPRVESVLNLSYPHQFCHSRESGNPGRRALRREPGLGWIVAMAAGLLIFGTVGTARAESTSTEPLVHVYSVVGEVTAGCFGLEDTRTMLSTWSTADRLFQDLDARQKEGWSLRQLCLEKKFYDQNTSVPPFIVYFLLAKTTASKDAAVADVRVGVWDSSRVSDRTTGVVLSPIVHQRDYTFSAVMRPYLTSVWRNNRWSSSVLFELDQMKSGAHAGKLDIYRRYYRFDPQTKSVRNVYTCMYHDSGSLTKERACKSINLF